MKKLIKYILTAGIIITSLHFVLLQWNFDHLSPQIQKYFANNYSIDIKLLNNIKIEILPFPRVSIANAKFFTKTIKTEVFIPKTHIKINLFKVFNTNDFLDFHNIYLYNPNLRVFNENVLQYFMVLKETFIKLQQNNSSIKFFIKNATVEILNNDISVSEKKLSNFDLVYKSSYDKNLDIDGSFSKGEDKYSFLVNAKNLDKALQPKTLTISLKNNLVNLYTNLSRDHKSNALLGKSIIYLGGQDDDKSINLKKFINQQDLNKVEANVVLDQKYLKIDNFKSSSNSIENINGEIYYYINSSASDIDVSIDKIDLDQISYKLNPNKKESDVKLMDFLNYLTAQKELTFSKFSTTSTKLHIKKILYKQKYTNDFILDFSFWPSIIPNERKILLNNFSMTLPGNSKFSVYGILYKKNMPTFNGQVLFSSTSPKELLRWKYKDDLQKNKLQLSDGYVTLKSEVTLMPHILQIYNAEIDYKKTKMLSDILALNYPSKDYLQLYVNAIADEVNLDNFEVNQAVDDLIYALYESDFDNSSKTLEKNTNNFSFLRTQKGAKSFILEVKDLTFKGQQFNDVNVNVDIDKNHLYLDQINVKHKLADYSGKVILSLSEIKPRLYIDLTCSKFNNQFIDIIFPSQEKLKKRYQEEQLKGNKGNNIDVSDVNFYSLGNFDGDFKLKIDKLYMKDKIINDFKLSGALADRNINIKNINFQGFDGRINANGFISTTRPVFSLYFAIGLSNVNPKSLFSYLVNSSNNSGYMSASGTLSTKGINKEEFGKNLHGAFTVQAKDIEHNGFGLNELVELPQLQISYNDKLERLQYYSKYGVTKFHDVKGQIAIENGIVKVLNLNLENENARGLLNLIYSLPDHFLSANSKFSFLPKKNANPLLISVDSKGNIHSLQTNVNVNSLENYLRKDIQ